MLGVFVHMMETALVLLVAIISYRIYHLYQRHHSFHLENEESQAALSKLMGNSSTSNHEYNAKMEALQKAQVFSGSQLLAIKRGYGNLQSEKFDWLRKSAAFYIIGAIEHIAPSSQYNSSTRRELVTLVLKSNLKTPFYRTDSYLEEAQRSNLNPEYSALMSAGKNAARNWESGKKIPLHMSFEEHLNRNSITA